MSIFSPWKRDFPIFFSHAHPDLSYLDSAATCLTPKHVADAMYHYQCYCHANSHKGLYQLSASVTERVETARQRVADFLHASSPESIIFTTGTTESLNLVASSYIAQKMSPDANIVISAAEHHANLLPWQRLCHQVNAELRVVKLDERGVIDFANLVEQVDHNTVAIAVCHSSNVIGKFNPVKKICQFARQKGIPSIVDGAQAVCHGMVDVEDIDCDFYAFSGHKLYGPTGCGVLYCRAQLIEQMEPYQVGGGVIEDVTFAQSRYLSGPLKFEAGSHNVASIVGLVEALDYLEDISWKDINQYLDNLSRYMQKSLAELDFVQPLIGKSFDGTINEVATSPYLFSFQLRGVHCHDVASMLDSENVAVRAGHHCAQPLHQLLAKNASVRASLGIYNSYSDVDRLVNGLSHTHLLMAIDQ
ncbi:aminotransferase class V-fold PLP-dependent enzyme [Thalassotalea ganghwensis]